MLLRLRPRQLLLLVALACVDAPAAEHRVTTLAALQTQLAAAAPGDTIVVADGAYTTTAPLLITRAGTATAPVTVRAATVGGVTLAGTHGFTLEPPAAHVVIQGFRFVHAAGGNHIKSGAIHVRFTRNTFSGSGEGAYLAVEGDHAEIDRNEFADKRTKGNMLDVLGAGAQVAQHVHVHHNYFHDFAAAGVNGAETIRFGRSWLSMSDGFGLVEHNLFVRCVGENELITNKSGRNIYRFNTFLDSPGAQLTLRHGNACLAYGNTFRRTDGLRVFGDRHRIFANYFEDNAKGIDMGNGGAEVADGAKLTSHDRPDDCVVAFNTFVNNRVHYQMGNRAGGLGALRVTVAHNLFQGGGLAANLSASAPHTATWTGNLLWQVAGPGDLPPDGFATLDPQLARDAAGILRPADDSLVRDRVTDADPVMATDADGQPRTEAWDVGADEFSLEKARAKFLTPPEVGPGSKPTP